MTRWNSLWFALLLGGCNAAAAAGETPLQGIVEHDERVLGFSVGGRVAEVLVRRGDAVEPGAALVRLDDVLERPLLAARRAEVEGAAAQLALVEAGPRADEVRAAEAELASVRAQAALVGERLERQTALVSAGALPAAMLDELGVNHTTLEGRQAVLDARIRGLRRGARAQEIDAAEARLRAAQAALAAVEARLGQHVLVSPGRFTVTELHASVGEVAGPGTAGVTVADLDHPFVDVYVPEARLASVSIGQRARVRVDGVADALVATVEHVGSRTEFTPRFLFSETERPNLVLRVRVRVEDPGHRLRAGLPAFVALEPASELPRRGGR